MPAKRDKSARNGLIVGLAGNQHGVVTRAQLIACGVSGSGISDHEGAAAAKTIGALLGARAA